MPSNGKLKDSELATIPGGRLRKDAAAAWNASGGPADANLYPTGSASSYRTFEEQEYFYRLYQEGRGNLAAVPGTSKHGYGIAVDLREPWMRDWIDEHGAKYGWRKTEAFSEWWHVNYVGGVSFPVFKPLKPGVRGKRVRKLTRRLAFVHRAGGGSYLKRPYWRYKDAVAKAVTQFQREQGLEPDGVVGPRTAARLNSAFKRQYARRGKR